MHSLLGLFSAIFDSFKSRLKNPLAGSFVISWIPLNWRIILILLFSEKTIEEKIDFISNNYHNYWLLLYIPLIFSIFYTIALPFITALVDLILKNVTIFRKKIIQEHRLEDIRHLQEVAAEEWQLDKIREGSGRVSELKSRVSQLEELVEEQEIESDKPDTESKSISRKVKRKNSSKSKDTPSKTKQTFSSNSDYPSMKEIIIRDLAKTEREWILIYSLFSSNFGKDSFTRDDILSKYDDSNRKTESRVKNLTNNINNMVKSEQIKYINDNDMLLTSMGVEMANEILSR